MTGSPGRCGLSMMTNCRLCHACQRFVHALRKLQAVQETVRELQARGYADVAGCACHVGSAEQRQAFISQAVQVRGGACVCVSANAVRWDVRDVLALLVRRGARSALASSTFSCPTPPSRPPPHPSAPPAQTASTRSLTSTSRPP